MKRYPVRLCPDLHAGVSQLCFAMLRVICLLVLGIFGLTGVAKAGEFDLPPGVKDTQPNGDQPIEPLAALKLMQAPKGFSVSLFAGEPAVRQPISFEIDRAGRLWVAECYAYRTWNAKGTDRLLIFTDTDNDGQYDERKVFWSEGNYLTGFTLGHGGVWVASTPNLLFIPDANGDDQPDGKAEIVLDGWSTKGVHNVPNGLAWGPDGWLYGCNGITSPSLVGKPGTPKEERTPINCGIWRYHPAKKVFDVVANGTTNPWGIDWNDHGHAFFTNCVIDHLWHVVPGAHYKRMFGEDFNPYAYKLMNPCSDHLHWAGGDWTKARGAEGEHAKLGGGHAHSGTMVYLGDGFPKDYRGSLFTCNIHGNRVNRDSLHRNKSGYVGKHEADFLNANDLWFRGTTVKYGPDGGVFVADWTDLGECHDRDGVHRSSGRIYKVTHDGTRGQPVRKSLDTLSDEELVQLQLHENDWWVRNARLILTERAQLGKLSPSTVASLQRIYNENEDDTRQLRALWCLYAIGAIDDAFLIKQTEHDSEHVRYWALQLLCDFGAPSEAARKAIEQLAKEDPSSLVRLGIASVAQRIPVADRWETVTQLAMHAEDADDENLALMIWYAAEPLAASDSTKALKLAARSKISLLRQYIARRIAEK